MTVYHDDSKIYFSDESLNRLGETDYIEDLWDIVGNVTWSVKKKKDGTPQYLFSNKLKKSLHQVVIDYYFGEAVRKTAYEKGMIIEHLNNNGFDCRISNLFFLLKIKNHYKGIYFDKLRKKSIPIVALNIFHIIENHTFQITIAFNSFFANKNNEFIDTLKLLYDCDYCTVLQDAEKILEDIVSSMKISIQDLQRKYRFKDYRIKTAENIQLTEEEKLLPSGSAIIRNGQIYIIKRNDDYGHMQILERTYEKDWN